MSARLRESGLLDECGPEILRCAQDDSSGLCHPERSEGSIADLWFLAPHREREHQPSEIILHHLELHLLVELIDLLLRGDSHSGDKGLEEFEDDSGITAKALVGFCPGRVVDHVWHVGDVDAPYLAQEASQHRQNAGKSPTLRKTSPL